jgi:tetratricopeptide (TPR) repeat protein
MRSSSNTIARFGLVALLLLAPFLAHADTAQYLGWGDQMLGQKNYDAAARYYVAALKADPRSAAAYRGLGYCYGGRRDLSHAARYLEYSLRLNPGDASVRAYLGHLYQGYGNQYYQRGDKNDALSWWNESLKANPENPQLSAYVSSMLPAPIQVTGAPATTPASAPKAAEESVGPASGINPWIMGGTFAVLGAIMIFLF